jgi:hypothetical protein
MLWPPDKAVAVRDITAGAAPLTKQRTTGRPAASWTWQKVAISLQDGSNGSVASRGRRSRVLSMSRPALCPRMSRAPSVGSPTTSPFTRSASLATR